MNKTSVDNRKFALAMLALLLLTATVYWQVLSHDFIEFDDTDYVTKNQHVLGGLTWAGVKWAFTTMHATNWHPLTWLSHMLDCTLFGTSPVGPHAVNLLFHLLNTALLCLVFLRLTGSLWRSMFVAGLFALHPMHVESVAWVAERKDLLSTAFLMLTILAYAAYVRRPRLATYVLVALLMALGLLAKSTLVTLPILLLLLDYWPLKRIGENGRTLMSLVIEKIPLFLLTIASSAATYWAQKSGGAVVQVSERLSISVRIDNAIVSYVKYVAGMFYPHKMAAFYPHPNLTIPVWQIVLSVVVLFGVTMLAVRTRRNHPYVLVGWLWFIVSLIPMIGLVQVGKAALADRYTYISYVGLFILVAWWIPNAGVRLIRLLPAASLLALTALSFMTWRQVSYWQNSYTLFTHALAVTSKNDTAHIAVGNYLLAQGKPEKAIPHYHAALDANPDSDRAHNNLGNALEKIGKADEAIAEYESALRLRPTSNAYFNIGLLLSRRGDIEGAIKRFNQALEIDPDLAEAHTCLAAILEKEGRLEEAETHYAKAAAAAPMSAEAHNRLGDFKLKQGDYDGAESEFRRALSIDPKYPEAHCNLANVLSRKGDLDGAIQEYNKAIALKPDYADAYFNLGVTLDAKQDMPQAMKQYKLALKYKPNDPEPRINLAVDLFISGDYAGSWKEVKLARKYGGKPHPGFIQALSAKMPEPAQ